MIALAPTGGTKKWQSRECRDGNFQNDPSENLILEVIKNDSLRQWEKSRRQEAERIILTAAKLIAPAIASSFTDGYAW